jgi:ATP-binding cassette subfamily F protein 3
LSDIETKLSEPDMYSDQNKAKLKDLLEDQAGAKAKLVKAEDAWFELNEELELLVSEEGE